MATADTQDAFHTHKSHSKAGTAALAFGSLGVVYGDIGTSPLYALREAVTAATAGAPLDSATIIGVLSLMLWSLLAIVTIKYVLLLLRADNMGEGGTLSLMALVQRALGRPSPTILILGAMGAALFFGDCVITPAISVLSAVEGLEVAFPHFSHRLVVPITVLVLTLLFVFQGYGTHRIARLFGPVMVVWFSALTAMGLYQLSQDLSVLVAFNPLYGINFILHNPGVALVVLGGVFLTVTGAEALYADLGHFGRKPIALAWLWFVCPALMINYLGQGAMVLHNPEALKNVFFMMVPESLTLPLVALATAATVIASQAVISGAFSMGQQAVQLGLLPRLEIRHTSDSQMGQIYMPRVNGILFFSVILLVLLLPSSSQLAAAYGISVTGTMLVTALMMFFVMWKIWKLKPWIAALIVLPFLFIEAIFLMANMMKFLEGAWVSLFMAGIVLSSVLIWRRGARLLTSRARANEMPLTDLIEKLEEGKLPRVDGTAIFLTSDPTSAPTALLHNLKHNKVLHKHNIILTIVTSDEPRLSDQDRVVTQQISDSFSRVVLTYGYFERPSVLRSLTACRSIGWDVDLASTSFYLSRRNIIPEQSTGFAKWRDYIFIVLTRNAWNATDYFSIPSDRVVEIGTKIRL